MLSLCEKQGQDGVVSDASMLGLKQGTFPSQSKIKSEVRKGNVENITPLVAKKARATAAHLPAHVQVWCSLDDLIAEGVGLAVTEVIKNHHPKKEGSAGFVTYLYAALENKYKDVLKAMYAEKRFVRGMYSADTTSMYRIGSSDGREIVLKDILEERPDKYSANEERLIRRIDAERAFIRVYEKASIKLRRYLIMWLLQPTETKYKMYGDKFEAALKELRKKAIEASIGTEHCRTIWKDHECRRNICKELCRPGSKFRTPKSDNDPDARIGLRVPLKSSLEGLVVRVAFDAYAKQPGVAEINKKRAAKKLR